MVYSIARSNPICVKKKVAREIKKKTPPPEGSEISLVFTVMLDR